MQKYEEAEQMTCTTSVERIGIKKGIKQGFEKGRQQGFREGLLAGIELGLALKFGITGLCLLPEIYKIENVHVLRAVLAGIRVSTEIEELRLIYSACVIESE